MLPLTRSVQISPLCWHPSSEVSLVVPIPFSVMSVNAAADAQPDASATVKAVEDDY
jgi:hypothetical protein